VKFSVVLELRKFGMRPGNIPCCLFPQEQTPLFASENQLEVHAQKIRTHNREGDDSNPNKRAIPFEQIKGFQSGTGSQGLRLLPQFSANFETK
jgi:hypothetical protein